MTTAEEPGRHEITRLLQAAREGVPGALDRLVPMVYDDLRRVAQRQLGYEHVERTLNPTALVHEAYLKLARGGALAATDRAHFLAIAARAMRQVLVDQARERKAAKRGGGEWERTTLTDGVWVAEFGPDELLALEEALQELEPRQRQVVEYRFFGGMEEQGDRHGAGRLGADGPPGLGEGPGLALPPLPRGAGILTACPVATPNSAEQE